MVELFLILLFHVVFGIMADSSNISIYMDKLNPQPGETVRISCSINDFVTYATWRRETGQPVTSCTIANCSLEYTPDRNYTFDSNKNGIHVTIMSLEIDEQPWICTYATESKTIHVRFKTFAWKQLPDVKAEFGSNINLTFTYEYNDIPNRLSFYKENCTSSICENSLVVTYWKGKTTYGEQYHSEKMQLILSNNSMSLSVSNVTSNDTGNYTCVVELLQEQNSEMQQARGHLDVFSPEGEPNRRRYLWWIIAAVLPLTVLSFFIYMCFKKTTRDNREDNLRGRETVTFLNNEVL